MPYYNTQWHKITYINTKYLTKKEAFFQGFQALFLIFNCQTPELEERLEPHFIRVHRAYLVRDCQIAGLERKTREILLKNGERIPFSRTMRTRLEGFGYLENAGSAREENM